jgi:hypothetical protein
MNDQEVDRARVTRNRSRQPSTVSNIRSIASSMHEPLYEPVDSMSNTAHVLTVDSSNDSTQKSELHVILKAR